MLRKCGLFVLSLAVLSTSFSVFFSDVSRAWSYSSQPVICSTVPSFPLEYVQSNVDDFDPDTWPWAIVGYKDGSGNITSYKFFTQVPSSGTFQWVHGTDRGLTNANITTWPQYAYWFWLTGAYVSIPSLDSTGSTWGVRTNATGGTGMMFSGTSGDNECLASHSNIPRTTTFNTNFGESTPVDGTYTPSVDDGGFEPLPYEDCDALDIMCHFHNAYNLIINVFAYLFIPDPDDLLPYWDTFSSTFMSGVGLLGDAGMMFFNAYELLADVVIDTAYNGSTCPVGEFSFFDSAPATIHFCAWRYQFPALWTLMQTAIQAGISLTLVYVFWRKLNKMTGRDVEDGTEIEVNPYPGQSVGWIDERTGERGKIK